ncbi:MAG: LamG-like jellyroll fold domain-containing protein [Paludibacter sp.]
MKARNLVVGLVILVMSISGVKAQSTFGNALNLVDRNFAYNQVVINDVGFDYKHSTIECWVQPGVCTNNNHYATIVGKYYSFISNGFGFVTPERSFSIMALYANIDNIDSENKFQLRVSNSPSVVSISQVGTFVIGNWYHLAATFSATSISFYVNGQLQGTVPASYDKYFSDPNPLKIGFNYMTQAGFGGGDGVQYWDNFVGSIDELRVWNYDRTQQQIVDNKDKELVGNESGLYEYYNFNSGTAGKNNAAVTTLIDNSATHNNGSLSGFILTDSISNWVKSFAGCNITTTTATLVGGVGFTANWSLPSNGLVPDRYTIDLATDSTFTNIVSISNYSSYKNFNVGNVTSYRFHNLQPLTSYFYRVRALVAGSASSYSSVTKVTTIAMQSQTINPMNPLPVKKYGDPDFDLSATSTSGLAVQYSLDDYSSIASFTGSRVHLNRPGSAQLRVSQNGDDFYMPAPSLVYTLTIDKAELYVKATNYRLTYKGNGLPWALTCDYTGWVNGDTSTDVGIYLSSSVNQNNPVGFYPGAIKSVNNTFYDTKYNIHFTPGDITVVIDSTQSNAAQTITFNAISTKGVGDYDFAPVASASSGLPISFSSSNPSVATIVNGKIHIVDVGSCVIYANQAGLSPYFQPAQVGQTLTIVDVNNALNFDGVDDYVICGNILPTSYTKEAWIKPISTTGFKNIISGSVNHAFWLVNGQLCSGHNGGWYYVVDPATVPLNTWTHVAVTYDVANTTMKLYKNGVLVNTNNAVPAISGDNSMIIGTFGNNVGDFNGDIDEVKIWNRALTDSEIATDKTTKLTGAESGLVAYYGFNSGTASANNAGINILLDKSTNSNNGILYNFALIGTSSNWIASSRTDSKAEQTISFNSLLPKQIGDFDFAPGATASSSLAVTYTSSDLSVATIVNGKIHIVGAGTCTIYADQSGNLSYNPAAQVGQTLTVSAIVNNNALNFDGANDYVNCGNILTASYTKEAWIKPSVATGYLNIVSGSTNHAFWVVNGQLCSGHNGNWFSVVDNATIPVNVWTHVAISYDAATTTMKLYKNGTLVMANNSVPAIVGDNSVMIGTYANSAFFNGDMDEIRIWNRALTDAEIAADKSVRITGTESGLVAYYDFNSGTAAANNGGVTTLQDKSANGNNGVLYNFALNGATSNWVNSNVVVLKNQAAPTVTVNDINFLTESVVNLVNTMEYSIDAGTTWLNVPDNKISVAPFLSNIPVSVQIRYKANATNYASPSSTIILPARPQNTPAVSASNIDYTSNRIAVMPGMQYSADGGVNWHSVSTPSPVSGINQKAAQTAAYIDLTPYLSTGVNLMIRNQPTATDFGSSYVTVVIPGAPAAPTNPVENTTDNTFGFTLNPLYPDLSAYEFSEDNGTTFQTVTTNPIAIGSQILAAGDLSVRVKAVPSLNFAGLSLQNVSAYNSVQTALKNTETADFVIYPNPANDFITISGATNARIVISDLKGRMLLNVQAGSNQIDIRSLAKGIYVLKVQSEDKQVVGKLVKE